MMKLDRDVLFWTRDYFYNTSYLYENPKLREKPMSYNIVLYKFEKILKMWYNCYLFSFNRRKNSVYGKHY